MSVVELRPGVTPPVWLTKRQLSEHPSVRRSTRWVEQQVRVGLPSTFDGHRRLFCLPDVLAWLKEHHPNLAAANARAAARVAGVQADDPPPDQPEQEPSEGVEQPTADDRIADLEKRVETLEREVRELRDPGPPPAA